MKLRKHKKELPQHIKDKLDEFLDSLYLDFQAAPTAPGGTMTQEYIIKLLTRFIMGVCTAFWSIAELVEYVHNRREFREFIKQ